MQREPSLHELKEERRRLESDLMSATGRNQIHIGTLPSEVSRKDHNRSIHSPVMTNAARLRFTPSPPLSAISNRSSRSPSTTHTPLTSNPVPSSKTTVAIKPAVKPSLTQKPALTQINKLNSPKVLGTTKYVSNSNGNNLVSEKPARPDSVDDSSPESSSVSSSSSSNHHRPSSAQKFRQMVFEWRD